MSGDQPEPAMRRQACFSKLNEVPHSGAHTTRSVTSPRATRYHQLPVRESETSALGQPGAIPYRQESRS